MPGPFPLPEAARGTPWSRSRAVDLVPRGRPNWTLAHARLPQAWAGVEHDDITVNLRRDETAGRSDPGGSERPTKRGSVHRGAVVKRVVLVVVSGYLLVAAGNKAAEAAGAIRCGC